MLRILGMTSAALLLAVGTAHAAGGVEGMTVTGNQRIDSATITGSFPKPADGRHYSDEDLDAGIKQLASTGFFSDLKAVHGKGVVVVTVAENPYVGHVVFNGNKRLSDAVLSGTVHARPGAPIELSSVDRDVAAIVGAYEHVGRHDARVEKLVVRRPGNVVDIQFTIVEGVKAKIADIQFKGAAAFPSSRLRNVISTKETGLLSFLKNDDIYDVDRLETDADSLRRFYRANGYEDVKVDGPEVVFDDKENAYYLVFDVDEGRQYKVGKVEVDSTVQPAPAAIKTNRIGVVTGGIYSPFKADEAAAAMENVASTAGTGAIAVTPRTSRHPEGLVDVTYQVDKAPRLYVERIAISGNFKTADYVIRREIDLSEGDVLDRSRLKQAEKRLRALGYLKDVSITTAKGSADDRVVVDVAVVEDNSGSIQIGGGYSAQSGPMAILSIDEANFMGTGRGVRASVGRGENTGTYELSFTEPYFMGDRVTGGFDVYRRDYSDQDNRFHPYDETLTGGKFSLSAPITDDVLASVYYSLSDQKIDNVEARFDGDGTKASPRLLTKGDYVRSVLGGEWSFSSLDDRKNPTEGVQLKANQEFAGLGGDAAYAKTEVSARAVQEISAVRDIVAQFSVKGGAIDGIGKDLTFTDQFRPGSDLVRGFANGGIGPRDATTGFALGGQYYAGASAEARAPMPLVPEGFKLQSAFFADAGTVWHADSGRVASSGATAQFDGASVRASLGTGVIWNSPFGTLRADLALPVLKEDGDQTQLLSFSGGTRF